MTAMWLASLCVIVLSLARVILGQNNIFIYPSVAGENDDIAGDISWTIGSTQNIQWNTTWNSYIIVLYQQTIHPANGTLVQKIYTADNDGAGQLLSFNWQVQTYNSNISASPVYFLWLMGDQQGFTCHYFNITSEAASPSSLSSSSTSTAFTSSNSITTSVNTISSSNTPTQISANTTLISTSNTSSSTDAVKVGLGVGVGIGLPLVLITGIWIGLKTAKQRQSSWNIGSSAHMMYPPSSYPPPNVSMHYANPLQEAPEKLHEAHEAPGERDPIELGS